MPEGLLSSEEVLQYLQIDEAELERLIRKKKLTAYRIGGEFLRFSKDDVTALLIANRKTRIPAFHPLGRALDFVKYQGFYIISATLLATLIFLILQ